MKILIGGLIQFIGINGGVERVLVNFANEMVRRGHTVSILCCTEIENGRGLYTLDPKVHLVNLIHWIPDGKFESKQKNWAFKIRRELIRLFSVESVKNENTWFVLHKLGNAVERMLQGETPDVFISTGAPTTAAFKGEQSIPIITMTHADAESILEWISKVEREAVNQCDVLQVLMPHDKEVFKRIFPNVPIIWIPNMVPQYKLINQLKRKLIIDMARLNKKQKRQHLLIEAFSRISNQFPEWQIELWGDENGKNEYTNELNESIRKLHLGKQVHLCGCTTDVLSVYRRASILAFPSAYEVFPLAMTEAMSAGLPVVAYRSCPAVNELVRDGETGLLVDDGVEALAEGLKKLMEDQELRERMGRAAHESMKEFAPEKIWDQWEALMQDVIAKHKMKMER